MDRTAHFYASPSYVGRGAGFPIFSGSRRQRGGSILGSIKSLVLPTLATVGKHVGKTALSEAVGLAKDVVGDVVKGRNIGQSLKQHGLKRLKNVGKSGLQAVGSKFNPFTSSKRSKRKRNTTSTRQPAKKRRRVHF